MFGEPVQSQAKAAPSLPYFPIFLLPSFIIPFRRRRPAEPASKPPDGVSAPPTTSSPQPSWPIPSLSSSPSATTAASSLGTTPISLQTPSNSFFPSLDTIKNLSGAHATDRPLNSSLLSRGFATTTSNGDPTSRRLARIAADTIRCTTCAADIAFSAQVVSKGFTGRHGRAYLVAAPSLTSSPSCPATPPLAFSTSPSSSCSSSAAAADTADGNLINIRIGRPESRQLVTGAHVVADISCAVCNSKLGWKYVDAKEAAQKYKVGKFILETARVVAVRSWEDVGVSGGLAAPSSSSPGEKAVGSAEDRTMAGWRRLGKGWKRTSMSSSTGASRVEDSLAYEFGEDEDDEDEQEIEFDSGDEDECEDIFAGTWDAEVVRRRRSSKIAALRGR